MASWLLVVVEVIYVIIVILVCMRIIFDTRSFSKTLAYLLLVILVPLFGMIFYFSFGINYRKRKIYSKKLFHDDALAVQVKNETLQFSQDTFNHAGEFLEAKKKLIFMVTHENLSALTPNNRVKVLLNGEIKFPEVLKTLKEAKHHIHIEYYIYEDDETGRAIEEVLVKKAKEGVDVRFIYDDFGSRSIRRKMANRLKNRGVKIFPFYKVIFIRLANRINYRNHRKIIVVDGQKAFVGGINVSNKYVNNPEFKNELFWRDTHLMIEGQGVYYLQYLFMCDWNFCASENLSPNKNFFPPQSIQPAVGDKMVQIVASGPDSVAPSILFSLLQVINLAKEELLITTPYFIPGESIVDALIIAALGGVNVKLLVPGVSDSKLVNAAAHSYYDDLLKAGVKIYLYNKGFVHAKTMVADGRISVVGTANMDYRSFDLNFEVNAIVYDEEIAIELSNAFMDDIKHADYIDAEVWFERPRVMQLMEKTARLVSPLL